MTRTFSVRLSFRAASSGVPWSRTVTTRGFELYARGGATAEHERRTWGVFDFEQPVSGCRFAPRCPLYKDKGHPAVCTDPVSEPKLRDVGHGHVVACHFA